MDSLIINSHLTILNFKKSDFERKIKTAQALDKISSKIKYFFDKYGTDELVILARYKYSDDESGMVELRPFTHKVIPRKDQETGKIKYVKVLVPLGDEDIPEGMEVVYMTYDEYQNYLKKENISEREEKELRTIYDEDSFPEEEEQQKRLEKLYEPGLILISNIKTEEPYALINILKTDKGIRYVIINLYTDKKQLVSQKEMRNDFRISPKYKTELRNLIEKKEKEFKEKEEELEEPSGELELSTEEYAKIMAYVVKVVKKERAKGKKIIQDAIKKFVSNILQKRDIPESKFWEWYASEQEYLQREREEEKEMEEKLKTIASILGTTLTKVAVDILTEINPDEEKSLFNKDTGKEINLTKTITSEGKPLVTLSENDKEKTYAETSPELKNITDNLSEIIAFTSTHRKVLADLGYAT